GGPLPRVQGRGGFLPGATKWDASRYGDGLWVEVFGEVHASHHNVNVERVRVDALAARMVSNPASFDVVEARGIAHHPRSERVDAHAFHVHVVVRRVHLPEDLDPQPVAVTRGVPLRRARQEAAAPLDTRQRAA